MRLLKHMSASYWQVTELNVTTPSSVPPAFTVTAVSNFTEGTAILTVATNETAEVFYLVMLGQNTAVPSVGQVCLQLFESTLHPILIVMHMYIMHS